MGCGSVDRVVGYSASNRVNVPGWGMCAEEKSCPGNKSKRREKTSFETGDIPNMYTHAIKSDE